MSSVICFIYKRYFLSFLSNTSITYIIPPLELN